MVEPKNMKLSTTSMFFPSRQKLDMIFVFFRFRYNPWLPLSFLTLEVEDLQQFLQSRWYHLHTASCWLGSHQYMDQYDRPCIHHIMPSLMSYNMESLWILKQMHAMHATTTSSEHGALIIDILNNSVQTPRCLSSIIHNYKTIWHYPYPLWYNHCYPYK